MCGAPDAQLHGQRKSQHKGRACENQRILISPGDDGHHILLILKGDAEISAEGVFAPDGKLRRQRLIQPQHMLCRLALLLVHALHALPIISPKRIARGQPGKKKHQHDEQQKQREHLRRFSHCPPNAHIPSPFPIKKAFPRRDFSAEKCLRDTVDALLIEMFKQNFGPS